jgi:alpha-L-fucosidase
MTKAGINEAVRRNIPLRVGIIGVQDGQLVEQAKEVLIDLMSWLRKKKSESPFIHDEASMNILFSI